MWHNPIPHVKLIQPQIHTKVNNECTIYLRMRVCVSLDAHIRTLSRSCTARTAAGATLTRKAPHPRWARWWLLTAWPTTAALTAGWLWASQGVRSSAAQGLTWSEPTPWTAPPLTLQRRPPGRLPLRYNKTHQSHPYYRSFSRCPGEGALKPSMFCLCSRKKENAGNCCALIKQIYFFILF